MAPNPFDDLRHRVDMLRREIDALARREVPPTGGGFVALTGNQTIAGVKTFSNGIVVPAGTWTPVITSSNANFATSYTAQDGRYTLVGNIVFYNFNIVIGTISSAGTGDLRISLPFTNVTASPNPLHIANVDVDATALHFNFNPVTSQAYGTIVGIRDDLNVVTVPITALGNGDALRSQGLYFAS